MDFEKEIFKGKSFSSLLEDIYKNSKTKEKQIKELILQLKDMISEPGDAVMIVPLLQGYMEVSVKNDEALIKMAAIVQKAMATNKVSEGDGELLSELYKIALVHLYAQGYSGDELTNFELDLTTPSIIYDQEKIALLTQKVDLAQKIMETKLLPTDWIYDNILGKFFTKDLL